LGLPCAGFSVYVGRTGGDFSVGFRSRTWLTIDEFEPAGIFPGVGLLGGLISQELR